MDTKIVERWERRHLFRRAIVTKGIRMGYVPSPFSEIWVRVWLLYLSSDTFTFFSFDPLQISAQTARRTDGDSGVVKEVIKKQ